MRSLFIKLKYPKAQRIFLRKTKTIDFIYYLSKENLFSIKFSLNHILILSFWGQG
ncbi:hypothetical protein TOL5_12090 [Acinetobacter sp. Tol 5]|nr:hypothetical protein TOL5_12090 [Acinetobacter sp. Tol 5]